jgi:TonB family protein
MRRMLTVAVGMVLSVSALRAQLQMAAPGPDDGQLGKLVAANDLELKGNSPFYLSMSFQLFDINGKPKETGTLEKWWAAPGSSRYLVHMPGLNEDGAAPAGADSALGRDAYLIRMLSQAAVSPVMARRQPGGTLKQETHSFGKTSLSCFTQQQDSLSGQVATAVTFCTDPNLDDVRIVMGSDGNSMTLRNSVGKFHGTYVSLGLQISYFGRDAISGKITALHSFDPAKSEVQLPPAAGTASPISGRVTVGKRIQFVEPEYPTIAKMGHLSGSVLLNAVIAKDGSVRTLQPIASTDSVFIDAAMTAVQRWKYSPYLLNGEPTEVDTTITVNFQLN